MSSLVRFSNNFVLNRNIEYTRDKVHPGKKIGNGIIKGMQCKGTIICKDQSWHTLHIIQITPFLQLLYILCGDNLVVKQLVYRFGAILVITYGILQKVVTGSLIRGYSFYSEPNSWCSLHCGLLWRNGGLSLMFTNLMIQVHVDAWGCPLLPAPQAPCFPYNQVSINELNIWTSSQC